MKRRPLIAKLFALLCASALCAPPPARADAILVGLTLPRTGFLAPLAEGYGRGIELWADEVRAAGGLRGRSLELRVRDDGGEAARTGPLYGELLADPKLALLIGPFGSAATLRATSVAEGARRVLVNGSGAAAAVHKRGRAWTFQSATPYAACALRALEFAQARGVTRAIVLGRGDPASRETAHAAIEHAARHGIVAGSAEVFSPGTAEFDPYVARARKADAQAWIAFGHAADAAEMVKTFKRLGYAPALFIAQGAAEPAFIAAVGQDAEHAIGIVEWTPGLALPGNDAFVRAYRAKWSKDPDLAAAQGYSAARVAGEALRRAASLDPRDLRAALLALETDTPLGPYRVDPATGAQTAARTALVQIQRGKRVPVWPRALAEAAPALPYPRWDARTLIAPKD